MGRIEIFTGLERRRRWSPEEKAEILAEAAQPGVKVVDVARRHDLVPQQIYGWRRAAKKRSATMPPAGSFLPVEVVGTVPANDIRSGRPSSVRRGRVAARERIEITCRNGRVLKLDLCVDAERLQALIRAVETA